MNPRIFREYDIRGVAETDLTPDSCRRIASAIGELARRSGARTLTVARDCRLHSERIRDVVTERLVDAGFRVIDIGVCPTPVLYFSVNQWNVDGGVMITASHNSAPDNGFKIAIGKSTIHGEAIQELRRIAEAGTHESRPGGSLETREILEEYVEYIRQGIRPGRRLKIAIDAGNGPGGLTALPLLEALGHEIVPLFCEPDGRFPNHHPDPTVPENLESLIEAVRAQNCDLGIAYDGDADRIGVIDDRGQIIWGDRLLLLFARAILAERGEGTFIADVKCSRVLYEEVPKYGGRMLMWKTGHSLIKEKMKAEKALLAGEMSGHMFFADRYFGFDDAVYASARLVEILSQDDRTLSEHLSDVPNLVSTPEIRIDCRDDLKAGVVAEAREHFAARYETETIDGARVSFPKGWGLVRASNTGAILVLRFEAEDQTALDAIRAEMEGVVRAAIDRARESR